MNSSDKVINAQSVYLKELLARKKKTSMGKTTIRESTVAMENIHTPRDFIVICKYKQLLNTIIQGEKYNFILINNRHRQKRLSGLTKSNNFFITTW